MHAKPDSARRMPLISWINAITSCTHKNYQRTLWQRRDNGISHLTPRYNYGVYLPCTISQNHSLQSCPSHNQSPPAKFHNASVQTRASSHHLSLKNSTPCSSRSVTNILTSSVTATHCAALSTTHRVNSRIPGVIMHVQISVRYATQAR